MPSNPFRRAYIRIAEYVTKFYLELQSNYSNQFKDATSLLATAGFLTAEEYIPLSKILPLAKDAVSNEKAADSLFPFIFHLELAMGMARAPDSSYDAAHLFLVLKSEDISKAIDKTKKKYKGDKRIAYAIDTFMQSAEFKSVRETLNITD